MTMAGSESVFVAHRLGCCGPADRGSPPSKFQFVGGDNLGSVTDRFDGSDVGVDTAAVDGCFFFGEVMVSSTMKSAKVMDDLRGFGSGPTQTLHLAPVGCRRRRGSDIDWAISSQGR